MASNRPLKIALLGQPNCGKSTLFNTLSGAKQHIANYPGVTVDKKSAYFRLGDQEVELIDLPGIYSLSTFSPEERVSLAYLREEKPDLILNIIDASNPLKGLYLTTQAMEFKIPVLLVLNMADVAKGRGYRYDLEALEAQLGIGVILCNARQKSEKKRILDAIQEALKSDASTPILQFSEGEESKNIAIARYEACEKILESVLIKDPRAKGSLSDRIDKVVLHRYLALPILLAVIYAIYDLSIVRGYELTNYTWPYLAWLKQEFVSLLPPEHLGAIPILRDFGVWMANSILALLNYLPIFMILFSLIAILEDSGYMARMAFALDRLFRSYGLHGQSTLSYVMGGVVVGGCAVPAIMASRGIGDVRARWATILTVPFLNCLAKTPFFVLVVSVLFVEEKALVMFVISTLTVMVALIMAKILSLTLLRSKETLPFVMELPPYHLPTLRGVLTAAWQKVWLYLKKVVTVVLAVAVVLFVLIQFPGVSKERQEEFDRSIQGAYERFVDALEGNSYQAALNTPQRVMALIEFSENYKQKRMGITTQEALARLDEKYAQIEPLFFKIVRDRSDKEAAKVERALRQIISARKTLFREVKDEKIANSYLGIAGRALESVTQYAGFDWKINIAFLSSFAARESFVATLGALFEEVSDGGVRPEEGIRTQGGYSALAGVAMILFMALTPPCIATIVVLKTQLGSWRWTLFALLYPLLLALAVAIGVYSIGNALELSAMGALLGFYGILLALLLALGFFPRNVHQTLKENK
ncbi:ferrous iron transporter B [Wolinella succinogenes]|uniref:ferrous iron transporter B n=1 Tax=Wolinella succinogenes TaxID=844 RepID=UPI002FCCB3D2